MQCIRVSFVGMETIALFVLWLFTEIVKGSNFENRPKFCCRRPYPVLDM